jgi:NDP-sugar pyrophosphorylase family protein
MSEGTKLTFRANGAAMGLRTIMLAGGKGVRLHPFTANFPKPLVPLGDVPIIEVLMKQLVSFGITDITLTLGHLAELMKAYFHHRQEFTRQLELRYVEEAEPLGTAGSLAFVRGLDDTFLVMNGDLLTDLNFDELVAFHREQGATLTIAAHKRHVKIDLGVLEIGDDLRITGYREKPETTYHVSMGIYAYEPRVLRFIESGKYLDFPDLVLRLMAAGEKVCAFPCDCLWLDIGRPDDYAKAQEMFAVRRQALLTDQPKSVDLV